ncbi:DHH family phosphoesterase [Clostridium sp.]|uniref:DHH family phosphoesterase n=1 Tax=Clostridium sp. TaxID=1506 RepID=UPI0025C5AD25|nr:DHH family phosphoesterase [Clostridium sp.]
MNVNELFKKDEEITLESYLKKCNIKDIKEFCSPSGKYLDNCFLYEDIRSAVAEVKYLLNYSNSTIVIVQDADLDGICSTVILYQYLSNLNPNWNIRILIHKGKERGLSDEDVMNDIILLHPDLVFVPDAGTNDKIQAEELCKADIGLVVIDHHNYDTPIEKGILINNQNPNYKVQRDGSGTLVTHKFLQAMDIEFNLNWSSFCIDLVALSLISDSMNMNNMENRTYYHYGLETIDCVQNEFLRQCMFKFIGDKEYTQRDIAFKIVPKFNSIVRSKDQILKQRLIYAFLGQDNIEEVLDLCAEAHKNQIETVNNIIEANVGKIKEIADNNLIVLSCDDMPRSYSGLIAGKVMNMCDNKPTIVGKIIDGEFIGSLRSPIPLQEDLDKNELIEWCHGHAESAGICIKETNIDNIVEYYNGLNLSYSPQIDVLQSYSINDIPNYLFNEFGANMDVIWGKGLEQPKFHITLEYNPIDFTIMGKSKTTLKLKQNGIDIMWFFTDKKKKEKLKIGYINEDGDFIENPFVDTIYKLEIIGTLGINVWNNRTTNQIIVEDFEVKEKKIIKPSDLFI